MKYYFCEDCQLTPQAELAGKGHARREDATLELAIADPLLLKG